MKKVQQVEKVEQTPEEIAKEKLEKKIDKMAHNAQSREFFANVKPVRSSGNDNTLYITHIKRNGKKVPISEHMVPDSIRGIFTVKVRSQINDKSGAIVVDEDVPNSMRQIKGSQRAGRELVVEINGISYEEHQKAVPVLKQMIQAAGVNKPGKRVGKPGNRGKRHLLVK